MSKIRQYIFVLGPIASISFLIGLIWHYVTSFSRYSRNLELVSYDFPINAQSYVFIFLGLIIASVAFGVFVALKGLVNKRLVLVLYLFAPIVSIGFYIYELSKRYELCESETSYVLIPWLILIPFASTFLILMKDKPFKAYPKQVLAIGLGMLIVFFTFYLFGYTVRVAISDFCGCGGDQYAGPLTPVEVPNVSCLGG